MTQGDSSCPLSDTYGLWPQGAIHFPTYPPTTGRVWGTRPQPCLPCDVPRSATSALTERERLSSRGEWRPPARQVRETPLLMASNGRVRSIGGCAPAASANDGRALCEAAPPHDPADLGQPAAQRDHRCGEFYEVRGDAEHPDPTGERHGLLKSVFDQLNRCPAAVPEARRVRGSSNAPSPGATRSRWSRWTASPGSRPPPPRNFPTRSR